MKNILVIILMIASCGRSTESTTDGSAAPANPEMASLSDINTFMNEFFQDAKIRGLLLNRSFVEKVELEDVVSNDTEILGLCSGNAHHQVLEFKTGQIKSDMKVTVYHELGHCMLGESHTKSDEDIMYADYTTKPLDHWKQSVDKLFKDVNQHYIYWTVVTTK